MNAGNDDAGAIAQRFVDAVARGEHTTIWELLDPEARERAIAVAVGRGLDRVRAQRLRDGVSDPVELEDFLRQVLHGLRRDLRSVEVDRLTIVDPPQQLDDGMVAVALLSPSTLPGIDGWPAGRLLLTAAVDGGWSIVRLEPVVAGP